MNPVSIDIKDMLEDDNTLGLNFRENLFISTLPDSPNRCIAIFDTAGRPPLRTLNKTEKYCFDAFQVIVRSTDYEDGYAICDDILNSLHARAQETWNETLYSNISCVSGPAPLSTDGKDRYLFSINLQTQRREA